MSEIEISTKSLSLNVMSVTIKSLHVDSKQMTLAVFRQIPVKQETENFQIWGIVRYEIKNMGSVWVIFSQDGKLYKRAIDLDRKHISSRDADNAVWEYNDKKKNLKEYTESLEREQRWYESRKENHPIDEYTKNRIMELKEKIETCKNLIIKHADEIKTEREKYKIKVEFENLRLSYEESLMNSEQLFIAV